jgi:hypothetical protein
MKLASRLGDFLRSLFKVTGIPQATTVSKIKLSVKNIWEWLSW